MKILVVDDQKSIAEGIKAFLIQRGFEAFCVHSGSEALNFLEQEPCDLVISDFKMPDLNGLELLKELRSKNSTIFFIMISAYLKMEDLLEAIKLKISDVFSKPFKNIELLQSIESLKSQQQSPFHPKKNTSSVTGWNHSVTEDYDLYLLRGKSFQGYFSYSSEDKWRFLFYDSEKYSTEYLEGCFFALNKLKKSFKDTCLFLENENFPIVFVETDFRKKVEFFNPFGNPVFYINPEGEMCFFKEKWGKFEINEQGVFGISEGNSMPGDLQNLILPRGFSRLHPLFLASLFSARSSRPFLVCGGRQKKYTMDFDFKKNKTNFQQLREWLDFVITTDLKPSCAFIVKSFFSDLCDLQDNEKKSFFERMKFEITPEEVCIELFCSIRLEEFKEFNVMEGSAPFLDQLLKHRHDYIMKYAEFKERNLFIRIPAL